MADGMTMGACLVANEPDGLTKGLIQARVQGKSWKQIADEFGYANPSAARTAFKKITGIGDFKVKGPKVQEMFDALNGKNPLADDALKAVIADPATAKQLKYIDDLITKLDVADVMKFDPLKLTKKEASELIDQLTKAKLKPPAVVTKAQKIDDIVKLEKQLGNLPSPEDINLMKYWDDKLLDDELKALQNLVAKKTGSPVTVTSKAKKVDEVADLVSQITGVPVKTNVKNSWMKLSDEDLDALIEDYTKQVAKNANISSVQASVPGKQASKKLVDDWVSEVEPKPLYLYDGDVIQALENGDTYANIAKKFGKTFDEIDETNFNRLLDKNNGDVWKAFKEKPTSQRGEAAVKKMFTDAQQHGVPDTDFQNLTGIDSGTLKALKDGTWTKSPPGSYKYTPPAQSSGYAPYSSSQPSYPSGTQQVGRTTANFERGGREELDKLHRKISRGMDPDVKAALQEYTGSSYMRINTALRNMEERKPFDRLDRTIRNMDRGFHPAPRDMHVVRGTGRSVLKGNDPTDMVGTTFVDHGYMSTSIGSGFGGDVRFVIDIPEGTPMRWVNPISKHRGEDEVLLPRETKFMIEGVSKSPGGQATIYMRVIGHGITG